MIRQIKTLTVVQLRSLFHINETFHTKDTAKRKRLLMLMAVWLFVGGTLGSYSAMLSAACTRLGLPELIPAFLLTLTSMLIFVLSVFSAGQQIFQMKTYDMTVSLPVSPAAIVTSRFLTMYAGNLVMSMVFMLPGLLVYAGSVKPGPVSYLTGAAGMILAPLLPMTLACMLGAVILAVSSRLKYKSLISAGLSLLFVIGFLGLNLRFSRAAKNLSGDTIKQLSESAAAAVRSAWPPAALFSRALTEESLWAFLAFAGISCGIFLLFLYVVQKWFTVICTALGGRSSSGSYVMQTLRKTSPLKALYQKELRRYFSSSVYVINTMIGYLLMAAASVSLCLIGTDALEELLGLPGTVTQAIPLFFAALAGMTSITSCSVSMEGRQWWITQSLPLRSRDVWNGKILLQLSIAAPCYVISEFFLFLSVRTTPAGYVLMLALPAVFIVYGAVLGLFINLRFPVFDWPSETVAVKQSMSVVLYMLAVFLSFGGPIILAVTASAGGRTVLAEVIQAAAGILVLLLTAVFYHRIGGLELAKIQ